MKRLQGQSEMALNSFGFDVLTSNEMNAIKGGVESKPKSRPKEIYDFDLK